MVTAVLIFGVLGARANLTFLPIRDYRHFVTGREQVLFESFRGS